ncbi:unannotated protein [freshwater metagenome]|uniref:Unannotated protein n=1 Tax=freshwater metagenome TaxID=449393 RepID=A0A6J7UHB0_9ZZZZ
MAARLSWFPGMRYSGIPAVTIGASNTLRWSYWFTLPSLTRSPVMSTASGLTVSWRTVSTAARRNDDVSISLWHSRALATIWVSVSWTISVDRFLDAWGAMNPVWPNRVQLSRRPAAISFGRSTLSN